MPLVHVDGTGQITWVFNVDGTAGHAVITCGFRTAETEPEAVAAQAGIVMRTFVCPVLSSRSALLETKVLLRIGGETLSASDFFETPKYGSEPANILPSNCAVLVQKRTALAGRKNRGRMYVPGICSNRYDLGVDPNTMKAISLTEFQDRWDSVHSALLDGGDSEPIQPVILHPSPSNTTTDVTAFSVQARLATQRGRLRD